MSEFLQQLARVRSEVRSREEMIKEKQLFLDNEVENNKEQEKKISLAERAAAKMRLDYQEAEAQRDQFQSEVCDLNNSYVLLLHCRGDNGFGFIAVLKWSEWRGCDHSDLLLLS